MVFLSSNARVWLFKNGTSPCIFPQYQGKVWIDNTQPVNFGTVVDFIVPDPSNQFSFIQKATQAQQPNRFQFTISNAISNKNSIWQDIAKNRCFFDIQAHLGKCKNPKEYDFTWEKIYIIEDAVISTLVPQPLGTQDKDNNSLITEEITANATTIYEVVPIIGDTSLKFEETFGVLNSFTLCKRIDCECDCFYALSLNTPNKLTIVDSCKDNIEYDIPIFVNILLEEARWGNFTRGETISISADGTVSGQLIDEEEISDDFQYTLMTWNTCVEILAEDVDICAVINRANTFYDPNTGNPLTTVLGIYSPPSDFMPNVGYTITIDLPLHPIFTTEILLIRSDGSGGLIINIPPQVGIPDIDYINGDICYKKFGILSCDEVICNSTTLTGDFGYDYFSLITPSGYGIQIPNETIDDNSTWIGVNLNPINLFSCPLHIDTIGEYQWLSGENGIVWKQKNYKNEVKSDANTDVTTNDIHVKNGDFIITVGYSGSENIIKYTKDGGDSWEYVTSVFQPTAVFAIKDDIWLIGNNIGELYATCDGGKTFNLISIFSASIIGIIFPRKSVGFLATTDEVYRTTNGGNTWKKINTQCSNIEEISSNDENNVYILAICNSIKGVYRIE